MNPSLPAKCRKTEILFLHLYLRLLENGGRVAVIEPDGVLFGSSNAHVEIRRKLIEENRLDGVVSMPSGVFRPYAGVSTAVLLFTRSIRWGEGRGEEKTASLDSQLSTLNQLRRRCPRRAREGGGGACRTPIPHRPAGKGNQPAWPPILGGQGTSRRPEL